MKMKLMCRAFTCLLWKDLKITLANEPQFSSAHALTDHGKDVKNA